MSLKIILPPVLWAMVIFLLTMMPGKYVAPANIWDLANFDKLAHAVVFAILAFLSIRLFLKQFWSDGLRSNAILWTFLICASYGLLLETMQGGLLKDRYFEWDDVAANSIGCVLGIIIYKFVEKYQIT